MKFTPEIFASYLWEDSSGDSHFVSEEDAGNLSSIAENHIIEYTEYNRLMVDRLNQLWNDPYFYTKVKQELINWKLKYGGRE